mgnify:CR=1 FL=1
MSSSVTGYLKYSIQKISVRAKGSKLKIMVFVPLIEAGSNAILFYRVFFIPYRTKVFIGINFPEICNCQNRERFIPTKNIIQQVLVA